MPSFMNLLVFAATPPPPHGQARMVELMLEGLPLHAPDIHVFHVNSRLATSLEDMGRRPWAKVLPLLHHLAHAASLLKRHPIDAIYYCPGRATLNNALRDLFTLSVLRLLARKFIRHSTPPRLILHWHAVGLESGIAPVKESPCPTVHATLSAWVHARLKRHLKPARHIALSQWHSNVLKKQLGVEATVVPYGIPDPVPANFSRDTPIPRSGADARRLLFMSMLTRSKGVHATLAAHQHLLSQWLKGEEPHPWRLDIAGSFIDDEGRDAWSQARASDVIQQAEARTGEPLLIHHGFADSAQKAELFRRADVFCFPTNYESESFGLVVLEAMAWGVPVVATAWHALPEILPRDYPFLLPSSSESNTFPPPPLAELISSASRSTLKQELRARFTERFRVNSYHQSLATALRA
jgi:glycosyltransferase involved in cell wall biosynthesis